MRRFPLALPLLLSACAAPDPARSFRVSTGAIRLPPGVVEIQRALTLPDGAHDVDISGHPDTVLRAAKDFDGRALIVVGRGRHIRLRDFAIDGNRAALERPIGLPPHDTPFARFHGGNGIIAGYIEGLAVTNVRFREVAGYALIVAASKDVTIEKIVVESSGGRNGKGRNNASGGILLEEGTARFNVRDGVFRNVLGNALWTHSLYTSPRNGPGLITGNRFETIGRDAIQIGHATGVRVENNTGRRIGYPFEIVDVEGGGIPVGVDTAGNVDRSVYAANRFEEINGKCIDLDGFHHGEVRDNVCINVGAAAEYPQGHFGIVMNNSNPDMQSEAITISHNTIEGMKFGGIFVIGSGHAILRNRLRNLNTAGCNESAAQFGCVHFEGEPDLLQSGIYLGRRAERPAQARGNRVEGNDISGHRMKTRCIGMAPGVTASANTIRGNRCFDE
jgi:hypothetical protein